MNRLLNNNSVWITGASSGIGLALARYAARNGAALYLFSSRLEALEEAADLCRSDGAGVEICRVDLESAEESVAAAEEGLARWGAPGVLVLNAGLSQRSRALETDLATVRKIIDINFFGAVSFGEPVIRKMLESGGGHVAVTSSVTGIVGVPYRSAYSASKHALKGYYESLSLEYADKGLGVSIIEPGYIKTAIGSNALLGDGSRQGHTDTGLRWGKNPDVCARRYWRAVLRGRAHRIIAGPEHVIVFFYRFLPWLYRVVGRALARRMDKRQEQEVRNGNQTT